MHGPLAFHISSRGGYKEDRNHPLVGLCRRSTWQSVRYTVAHAVRSAHPSVKGSVISAVWAGVRPWRLRWGRRKL